MADTKTNNTILAPMAQKGSLTGKITAGMISTDLSNYYEKDEVDELLSSKSNVDHNHDDKYPNLVIFNNRLSKKADVSHTHSYNELTDLPDLEDIGIDTSNLATKEELNGKADVDHNHIIKDGLASLDLQGAYDLLKQIKIDEYQMKQYAAPIEHTHEEYLTEHQDLSHLATKEELNGKADSEHVHDQYLTEHQSLDHLALKDHTHEGYLTEHQDISGKADITYVDNAINTALNGIESQLDEIIGEEV